MAKWQNAPEKSETDPPLGARGYSVSLEAFSLGTRGRGVREAENVLSEVGDDNFVNHDQEGIYKGEFFVRFHRDENGRVDSIIINNEKIYRREI